MLNQDRIEKLKKIVGVINVLQTKEDLLTYSYDGTSIWRHLPDAVVFPLTTEHVSLVMKMANEDKIPVTARGGGTNVSGGTIPIQGGIVLCLTKMNRIIKINNETLTAEVEAGLNLQDFNNALTARGLFYAPDPQSAQGCTLGGSLAENASGPLGLKYGVSKNYLLGLEVVMANGDIVKLGSQTIKNRMGYELATLFAGSEGTLGIITRMIVKLLPLPEAQKTMIAVFNDVETAGETVSRIIAGGIIPAKLEFIDNWFLKRFEELTHLGLPTEGEALLLIQCDGNRTAIEQDIARIIEICRAMKATDSRSAKDDKEAAGLWAARKISYGAVYTTAPTILSEDVTVPRDKISALIKRFKEIGVKYGFQIHIIGHVGDGNLHPAICTDVNNKEEFARAMQANEEMFKSALELGGVISGEHGIGLEKKGFIKLGLDPNALKMMKDIKHLFDPNNILNPGKYWED